MRFGNRIVFLLLGLGAVVGSSVLAFYFCGWATVAYARRPSKEWDQYPNPSQRSAAIVVADPWSSEVMVRTVEGSFFRCRMIDDQCVPVEPEEASHEENQLDLIASHCEGDLRKDPPPIEGNVLDSIEVRLCGADSSTQGNFVILADGSIWGWRYHWDWGPEFGAYYVSRCAAVMTAAVGMVLLVWLHGRITRVARESPN